MTQELSGKNRWSVLGAGIRYFACLALALTAQPVLGAEMRTQQEIATGLAGVLRGCETWVLDPASWIDGTTPFLEAMNLGEQVSEVASIPDHLKPPTSLRKGNRSFRIDVNDRAGFALVVSTEIPMCHIVGVGFGDFGTAITVVLESEAFRESWHQLKELDHGSSQSIVFRHRQDNRLELTLSQPNPPATRALTIRLLATAVFDPG